MGTSITIQEIGIESLDVALYLLRRFFREEGFDTPAEEMRPSLWDMVIDANTAVFVAWRGSEALGVATVTTSVGIEYGRSAELEDLYVLPQARGSGIASALIDAACSWCYQRGCRVVLATVTPEGETAHKLIDFYKRRGFVNTGRVILQRVLDSSSFARERSGFDSAAG